MVFSVHLRDIAFLICVLAAWGASDARAYSMRNFYCAELFKFESRLSGDYSKFKTYSDDGYRNYLELSVNQRKWLADFDRLVASSRGNDSTDALRLKLVEAVGLSESERALQKAGS